jgi:hypothetical protein
VRAAAPGEGTDSLCGGVRSIRTATPLGRNALPPGRRPDVSEVGDAGVDRRRPR